MAIHWYPGHMHKAQKEMKERLPQIHLFIEVLDARIPFSSENPLIAELRGNKPVIKVLSKTDLADPKLTARWQTYLEQEQGVKAIGICNSEPGSAKKIISLIRQMLPEQDAGLKNINTMIAGIPNVGKSTLINNLAERTIAKTGNEPAVTKSQQRINLGSGITLLDTPGILWPKVENPNSSYRLAASGAIKDTAMDYEDVGFFTAEYLLQAYPDLLRQRFDLEELPETELEFLEAAAARRGALRSGGRANLHKICEVLINELRSGKLGRITLETPEIVDQEKQQMALAAEKKKADKDARKQAFKESRKYDKGRGDNQTGKSARQRRRR